PRDGRSLARRHGARIRGPDQAADHRAAVDHDRAAHDPRGRRAAGCLARARDPGRRNARGRLGQRVQYVSRPRHRPGDASYAAAPAPSHAIQPEAALRFGFALGAVAFTFLALPVNVLPATLALSAIAFSVFLHTLWLQ